MNSRQLSKLKIALLAWSAIFIIAAEIIKLLHVEGRAATLVGLAELLLALFTGVAFGVAASVKSNPS